MKIFCDLDDVLTLFEFSASAALGVSAKQLSSFVRWDLLSKKRLFFETLPWTKDGKDLWRYLKLYKPTILSGVPRGHWAESQKRRWCYRELGENVTVITCESKKKYRFCQLGDILIDDRRSAGMSWEQSGGTFIQHKSAKETIERLQILLRINRETLMEGFSDAMREDKPIHTDSVSMILPGSLLGLSNSSIGEEAETVSLSTVERAVNTSSLLDSKLQIGEENLQMTVVHEVSCKKFCLTGVGDGERREIHLLNCMNGASAVTDEIAVERDWTNYKASAEELDIMPAERNRLKKRKSTVHLDLLNDEDRKTATSVLHCQTIQELNLSAAETVPMDSPLHSHDTRGAASLYQRSVRQDVGVRIETTMISDTNPVHPHNPKQAALLNPPLILSMRQSESSRRRGRRAVESDDDYHTDGRSDGFGLPVVPIDAVAMHFRNIQVTDETSGDGDTDIFSDFRETVDCLVMLLSFHIICGSSSIFGQNKEFLATFSGSDFMKSVCGIEYALESLGWERELQRNSTADLYSQRYGAFHHDECRTRNDEIRATGREWMRLVYLEFCLCDDRKVLRQVDVEKYIEDSVVEWGAESDKGKGKGCREWGACDGEDQVSRVYREDSEGFDRDRGEQDEQEQQTAGSIKLFCSLVHIAAYESCISWYRRVTKEAKRVIDRGDSNQPSPSPPLSLCLHGALHSLLFEVVCEGSNAQLSMEHKESYQHASKQFNSSYTETNLNFFGAALLFTDRHVAACPDYFLRAKLFQFYPIWMIGKGLCVIMEALERESLQMKKEKKKNWHLGMDLSVHLCLLLVRSKRQYPTFSSAMNKDEDGDDTGGGGSDSVSHGFEVLSGLRGHCWRRLLIDLTHLGAPAAHISHMYDMSLDDPTLSIENDESIHKKHKIFSDNKYLKNKSRRGKKNRQRLRQVENRDETAMVYDRRGGGGGGGGSESGSDYNTQEQTTPVKNIDGDSRRQLDHSEIRGGNGPDHPVSFSRGRGHTRLRGVRGERFYPVRTCRKNENVPSRCLYVLPNARYGGNVEHEHRVREGRSGRSGGLCGETGQRSGICARDVLDGTGSILIAPQLENAHGRMRGGGRGSGNAECVVVDKAMDWFDLKSLQSDMFSDRNETRRRDCMIDRHGCRVGDDEHRMADGIIVVAEDFALHHYLTILAGSRGRVDISLSRESQIENQKLNFSTHGKGAVSGRAVRYAVGREGEESGVMGEHPSVPVCASVWVGSWSEGHLWVSLLFLLMWDEIFSPSLPLSMPRSFLTKPLDFLPESYGNHWGCKRDLPPVRSNGFYVRRLESIKRRKLALSAMTSREVEKEVERSYALHKNIPCYGLKWETMNLRSLSSLASALGGVRLSIVLDSMLHYPETYMRGQPDLLFWRIRIEPSTFTHSRGRGTTCEDERRHNSDGVRGSGDSRNGINMAREHDCINGVDEGAVDEGMMYSTHSVFAVEVKSASDRLSEWQCAWLSLLAEAGVHSQELKIAG